MLDLAQTHMSRLMANRYYLIYILRIVPTKFRVVYTAAGYS